RGGPGPLYPVPLDRARFPVGRGRPLVRDVAVHLAFLEDVGPRPRRPGLVAHLAFLVPLRLAEHDHARRARVIELEVQADDLAVHHDLMVADDLDALDGAHAVLVADDWRALATRVVGFSPRLMLVHHFLLPGCAVV